MTVIGCDIGTQSTKGVLVDETGEVLGTATATYGVDFPAAGWAQQDPQDWTAAVESVVAELSAQAPAPVTTLGISAQVDGVVATDADLEPLHPALIWLDRRAADEASVVEEVIGGDTLYDLTGLMCDAAHSGPKMRWLLDRVGDRARHLLPPATMVTGWLTGAVAQDHANASSSMLYDIRSRTWSERLLAAFGLDVDLIPPIVDSTDPVGSLRPDVAERLGLRPECVVIAGTGDDHAGAVGAGAVRPGIVVDITGTAEPIGTTAYEVVLDDERLVEAHAHAVPGVWFIENSGFVSGGSVLWLAKLLGIAQSEVLERASRAPLGAGGLVFIPALSGSMAPRWNAHARGSFTDISMDHGSETFCRALVESCVFAARDVVDRLIAIGLPCDELRVVGGGARSDFWLQMKADVLGRPVRGVSGGSSDMGAAILAAVAAGWHANVATAAEVMVDPGGRVFEPDPTATERYEQGYARYRQMFDALEPTYRPAP